MITEGNLRASLADVVIVEIGDHLGDYAALLLAGLGAEVIKLEPPKGSPSRSIGPFASESRDPEASIFFWRYNLNKKSIILDLDHPAASAALKRILAKADILLLAGEFSTVERRDLSNAVKARMRILASYDAPSPLSGWMVRIANLSPQTLRRWRWEESWPSAVMIRTRTANTTLHRSRPRCGIPVTSAASTRRSR